MKRERHMNRRADRYDLSRQDHFTDRQTFVREREGEREREREGERECDVVMIKKVGYT